MSGVELGWAISNMTMEEFDAYISEMGDGLPIPKEEQSA